MNISVNRDVLGDVIGLIETTLKIPAVDVDVDADFETFGINSLIAMELMENIEKDFDVELTPAQFSEVNTVSQLADLLSGLTVANSDTANEPLATESQSDAGKLTVNEPMSSSVNAPNNQISSVLELIKQRYDVDLGNRYYSSLDEVVEVLTTDHTQQLLNYFGGENSLAKNPKGGSLNEIKTSVDDIAIVGISCRFADAENHFEFWDNLKNEVNSMKEIPKSRWDWESVFSEEVANGRTVSKWGALIDHVDCFDAEFFGIPATEAKMMDPQQRLLLEETYKSVQDAGIDITTLAGTPTGVFVGYEYSEYEHYLRTNLHHITDAPTFSSSSPTYYLANRLSYVFDFCGPSESVNVNCASSAISVNNAYYSLLNGESDIAIAAGVSLNLFADDYIASSQYGILSSSGTTAVFDDDADGFTRGEGVAAIVMKRLSEAERDKNHIYAIVRSSHQNNRGIARDISEIKYESITKVLQQSYAKAEITPNEINYIEVDGYATKWGDSFEYEGIKGAFEKSTREGKYCGLGSLKGNIGNVESVSGLAALIKLSMSLNKKEIPSTVSRKKLNTYIDVESDTNPLYIVDEVLDLESIRLEEKSPIRVGINSFADSGTNVHIVLEEYQGPSAEPVQPIDKDYLFVFSTKDEQDMHRYLNKYIDILNVDSPAVTVEDLAFTLQIGREEMNTRLAIVAGDIPELLDKLKKVIATDDSKLSRLKRNGIYSGTTGDESETSGLVSEDMVNTALASSLKTKNWEQIALLWVNGVSIKWSALWTSVVGGRASLPSYPFKKTRHWADLYGMAESEVPVAMPVDKLSVTEVESTIANDSDMSVQSRVPQWYFYITSENDHSMGVELSEVDKVELFFKQEAANQLNKDIEDISTELNFLELGMDSIGVADMIHKADILFGINLSPSTLFKYPEIGSFSEYLIDLYPEKVKNLLVSANMLTENYQSTVSEPGGVSDDAVSEKTEEQIIKDIVIPLQTNGRKAPIFGIPGADGSALSFQQFGQSIGANQPFYVIESVGLDCVTPPLGSLSDVVDMNIKAIKSVQTKGPYQLLGYSNGGIVAYEMASKLISEGEKVGALHLLDTISPGVEGPDEASETVAVFHQLVKSLGGSMELSKEDLLAVESVDRGEYLFEKLRDAGFSLPKKSFLVTHQIALLSERMCRNYAVQAIKKPVNVNLYRASNSFPGLNEDYGWNEMFSKSIKIHNVDATHYSILEAPAIDEVVKIVSASKRKTSKKVAIS